MPCMPPLAAASGTGSRSAGCGITSREKKKKEEQQQQQQKPHTIPLACWAGGDDALTLWQKRAFFFWAFSLSLSPAEARQGKAGHEKKKHRKKHSKKNSHPESGGTALPGLHCQTDVQRDLPHPVAGYCCCCQLLPHQQRARWRRKAAQLCSAAKISQHIIDLKSEEPPFFLSPLHFFALSALLLSFSLFSSLSLPPSLSRANLPSASFPWQDAPAPRELESEEWRAFSPAETAAGPP